jgi:hypothetical protein
MKHYDYNDGDDTQLISDKKFVVLQAYLDDISHKRKYLEKKVEVKQ